MKQKERGRVLENRAMVADQLQKMTEQCSPRITIQELEEKEKKEND